ncbi:MAG TPA: glycosyltransferase, partial [Chitinophagaceae bacterium]|nr:glycosyltransferase [Chitinophagaceae bacterium]
VIFVPYPFAAEDHQTVNAMALVQRNAAIMIKDSEAKEKLIAITIELSKDEKKQEELKKNITALAIKDADRVIAQEILKMIN